MISDNYGLLSELNDLNETKVYEYFTDRLNEIKGQLISCQEETKLRILQGKAQMLSEIITQINSAKSRLIELRKVKPSMKQAF